MNILFLFCHLPSLDSCNGLYVQLINEFKNHGHNVSVSAKGQNNKKSEIRVENGIEVIRIKSHDFTGVKSNIKKALAYQEYCLKQRYYTKKFLKNKQFDLIISHSLPPELAYIIGNLKKFFKCPFYLIQSDYTWQDAVAMGFFGKNSPAALYYRFWEKRLMKQADYIGCPTKGNFSFIKSYYPFIREEQFDLLPFWLNEVHVKPNHDIKSTLGLKDKFTVVYGGSAGAAQCVENVVKIADKCRDYEDISFVVIGRGPKLDEIKRISQKKALKNIIFMDFLPQDQYLRFLASCDVGLILLSDKLGTPNFPSKALSYLNMRVPILAALDHVTDFGDFLTENKAGLWAYSTDVADLTAKLLRYYNNHSLSENVKENGYNLYKKHLTTACAYNTIINKLTK